MGVKKGGKAKSKNTRLQKPRIRLAQKKTKKRVLKKTIKKAETSANTELSKNVPIEYSFWLSDGREIRNVLQLSEDAKTMSNETYSFHANSRKNDFADWIRDIVKNEELAYNVRKSNNQKEMAAAIRKFLYKKPEIENEQKADLPEKQTKLTAQKAQPEKSPIEKIVEEKKAPEKKPLKKATEAVKKKETLKQEKIAKPEDILTSLKRREEELLKEEAQTGEEEQKVNALKIELTKKRYELLKKRGELEKEMFEHFLAKKRPEPEIPQAAVNNLGNAAILDIGKEKVESLIADVRQKLANGEIEEATKKYIEANEAFNRSPIRPDEKRSLKFQIMELEADIKLAGIKHVF